MVSFIDEHRARYGVESICSQLPIAPSTYYHHKALEADPERRPERHRRDEWLKAEIQRVWEENFCVYGARKVWQQLRREGIDASVGTTGDSYDNALAETIIGLFKTEVIHHRGPWKGRDAVEYATLEWVDWFNNRRLLEPIGNVPPAEREKAYYRQLEESGEAA